MSDNQVHTNKNDQLRSHGVDELITRLREDGVSAGRQEADRLITQAQQQARDILDQAEQQAQQHLQESRREADAYRAAGEAALKMAMRDLILELKATLTTGFSNDVKRLVSQQMEDPQLLRQMIMEIVNRVGDRFTVFHKDSTQTDDTVKKTGSENNIELLLPEKIAGLDELRSNPAALDKSPLTELVYGLTRSMLERGVVFSYSDEISGGFQVFLKDSQLQLDLSEDAIASLILAHLQPRFRAILEGVVR